MTQSVLRATRYDGDRVLSLYSSFLPLSPLPTYMSSGVMVTTSSADLDFAVPLLLLLLLLLLSALARASSAAPRSSFSNRPCVAASMVVGGKGEWWVDCRYFKQEGLM